MGIMSLLEDPKTFLFGLLLSLPGILLALCGHEAAHAWVAKKCGDPTAEMMGRITLNPAKHLDPVGFVCMFLLGFGWAKPVPVNPNNFRHGRRDDLKVSLAGITANIIMCLIGFILLMLMFFAALSKVPEVSDSLPDSFPFTTRYLDEMLYVMPDKNYFYLSFEDLFRAASGIWNFGAGDGQYYNIVEMLIEPVMGKAAGYAYQMLSRFALINFSLAVFNLIPVPPLDGYHVLNDLILKRPLFAPRKAAQIASFLLIALIFIGNVNEDWDILSKALDFVRTTVFDGLTAAVYALSNALSLF